MHKEIAWAINQMAWIGDEDAKCKLRTEAKQYTIDGWKSKYILTLGGIGALTGVAGGPIGLILEGLDIAYLLASSGRGCYGIGHLKDRTIDYEADIALILAIWSGAAEAGGAIAAGKVGIKVAGKAATGMGINSATKLVAKSAMKFGAKGGAAVVPFAVTKIGAKIGSKMSLKWIPVVGGIVGAGINIWIMSGLMDAAESYYSNEYVILKEDLAKSLD